MGTRGLHLAGAVLLVASSAFRSAWAQDEERPFSERFRYGGEVTANVATSDEGYFNNIEYNRNGLRLFRVNFALQFDVSERISLLTEIRSDNLDAPEPYALYARIQPFEARAFHVQIGRIPPVFGAFSRRRYDYDNPLIGYPLAYQYRTTLRADAAPGSLDELLAYRGYGARTRYTLGDRTPRAGLPLLNPLQWDTGVEVKLGDDPLELAVALTQGTLGNPRVEDDNSGKQIAARLGTRPTFGWKLGASLARGDYVSDVLRRQLPGDGSSVASDQTSVGVDTELARGHWILRAEAIWSRWDAPSLAEGPLDALGWMIEGRYKVAAGFHVAARLDRLSFSSVGSRTEWDAPVDRLEAGIGYSFLRRLLAKFSVQWNGRDGGTRDSAVIPAAQLIVWF